MGELRLDRTFTFFCYQRAASWPPISSNLLDHNWLQLSNQYLILSSRTIRKLLAQCSIKYWTTRSLIYFQLQSELSRSGGQETNDSTKTLVSPGSFSTSPCNQNNTASSINYYTAWKQTSPSHGRCSTSKCFMVSKRERERERTWWKVSPTSAVKQTKCNGGILSVVTGHKV